MTVSPTIPDAEYDALVREHWATYAAWEGAARWLAWWRSEHPEDDRDDLDILLSPDFQERDDHDQEL